MGSLDRRSVLGGGLGAGGLALAAASGLSRPARAAADPVAETRYGKVRGTVVDGVHVFKGVRYGADTAPRRFQAPEPPTPWAGIADALAYGASSPQGDTREAVQSEDCLFLNVWTPALTGKRPVMVYFHGGAYNNGSGSSPLYDGTRLARRQDVVVVTVNHRLNAFGYLYLARHGGEAFADSGNAGQLDLVLSLRWVRDNIERFGGDPDSVMVFGQSGGGAKIATLMAMPAAAGLFHRVATMSGQQVTASGPRNAMARTDAFLKQLGIAPDQVDLLRTLPAEQLKAGLKAVDPIAGAGGVYVGPVLDERNLLRHPFYPDAPAQSAAIPMIIGNTHDETRNLIGGGDPSVWDLTWETLPAKLFPAMRVDINPDVVVAEYRRLYPAYSPSDVFFAATTAGRSWRGAVIELEERARQPAGSAPTWAYQFDFRSPRDGGKWGAAHAFDIPLVFDNIAAEGSASGTGPEAQALADRMSAAFAAFARTGRPDHPGMPRWEPFTLGRRAHMVFDVDTRMVEDPRGAERRLFAKVPFVQFGT
ncbi:MAG TPA: carboxylesterase/lipase family protein [Azospirillaceae bacterium]|nr:carboxylesterase/lipase family protein [Azospirillaceae bacterium]